VSDSDSETGSEGSTIAEDERQYGMQSPNSALKKKRWVHDNP
jgi:hypothetical protein